MKRLIVMLGVTGSSLSSVFIRTATAPSVVLVLYRMTIAVLLLSPVVLSRNWKEIRGLSRRELALCRDVEIPHPVRWRCFRAAGL